MKHNFTSDQMAILGAEPIIESCSDVLSGDGVICSTNTTYSVRIPSKGSVAWTKSSNLDKVGGNTSSTYTIKADGSGSGYVTVTIKNSQGRKFLTKNKDVWVGKPNNSDIDFGVYFSSPPNNEVATNEYVAIGVLDNPNETLQGITKYHWNFSSWSSYLTGYLYEYGRPGNNAAEFYLDDYAPSSQVIMVAAENACGYDLMMGEQGKMFYTDDYGSWFMKLSPNPVAGETTISIAAVKPTMPSKKSASVKNASGNETMWVIEVYDSHQNLKYKNTKQKGLSTTINTQNWKEGVYMVRALYQDKILTGKLVVKK